MIYLVEDRSGKSVLSSIEVSKDSAYSQTSDGKYIHFHGHDENKPCRVRKNSLLKRDGWFSYYSPNPSKIWEESAFYGIHCFFGNIESNGILVPFSSGNLIKDLNGRIKENSEETYITIGASGYSAVQALCSDDSKIETFIDRVLNFSELYDANIDIDIENQTSWTIDEFEKIKYILSTLAEAAHISGRKIQYSTAAYLSSELVGKAFNYKDLNEINLDAITVRLYGNQWSKVAGTAISPYSYIAEKLAYISGVINNFEIIPAINSYGYRALIGSIYQNGSPTSFYDSSPYTIRNNEVRDELSGELKWNDGAYEYSQVDSMAMRLKEEYIKSLGYSRICVWCIREDSPFF